MPKVRLSAQLPKGDLLGIDADTIGALIDNPDGQILVMTLLEVRAVTDDRDAQDKIVTLRARRIEVVGSDDTAQAQHMMLRSAQDRSGQLMFPDADPDSPDELAAAFQLWAARDPDGDESAREPTPRRGLYIAAGTDEDAAADADDVDPDTDEDAPTDAPPVNGEATGTESWKSNLTALRPFREPGQ